MSLTKLLKAPIKLFKKEVITFLIIRRYDLGVLEDTLRYIAVRPSASIMVLRQKVWHLLDLPDFCEEIILLKSNNDVIPLTDLRKGNNPHNPFVLEVWLPNNANHLSSSTTINNNMLTIGNGEEESQFANRKQNDSIIYENTLKEHDDKFCAGTCFSQSTLSNDTIEFNKLRISSNKQTKNTLLSDFKKSDLSCRISSTSLFRMNRRKSSENFTNILLKIQSDLSTLSNKLSVLETKLPA